MPAKGKGKRKVAVPAKRKRAKRAGSTGPAETGVKDQRPEVGSDSRIEQALRGLAFGRGQTTRCAGVSHLQRAALRAMASRRPGTARELLAIPGVGITIVEKYGRADLSHSAKERRLRCCHYRRILKRPKLTEMLAVTVTAMVVLRKKRDRITIGSRVGQGNCFQVLKSSDVIEAGLR